MSGGESDLTEIDWLPKLTIHPARVVESSTNQDPLIKPSSASQTFEAKNPTKPSHSYGTLISMAINSTANRQMTLAEIYRWVANHFEYYKYCQSRSWKNSIRHNLSLSKQFIKIPRGEDDPGKGCYWTVDDTFVLPGRSSSRNILINKKRKRQTLAVSPYVPESNLAPSNSWSNVPYCCQQMTSSGSHEEYLPDQCTQAGFTEGTIEPIDFNMYSVNTSDSFNAVANDDGMLLRSIMESAGIPLDDDQQQFSSSNLKLQMTSYLPSPNLGSSSSLQFISEDFLPDQQTDDFDWDLLMN